MNTDGAPFADAALACQGANVYNDSETVAKFEMMDGAPVRGESIPIRMFLSGFEQVPRQTPIAK